MIKNYIIPFDPSYKFYFLEEKEIKFDHPVSDYYLKYNDLSVNVLITLKWAEWAYKFLTCISEELTRNEDGYELENLFVNPIQDGLIKNFLKKKHIFQVDDVIIYNFNFLKLYDGLIFNENSKLHFKLKINLDEFFLISNTLFPTFICEK